MRQESHQLSAVRVSKAKYAGASDMESVAYILILTLAIGTLFFAIAFREPPRIERKDK